MDASLGDIADRLRELLDVDRGVGDGSNGAAGTGRPAALTGDALLSAAHAWERAGRATDAARTWVAAEVENESRRELEGAGLAYRRGFSTAKKLIAATTNVSERTAASRIAIGTQLRSSRSVTGLPLPSFFPAVEAAFFDGQLGVDAASMICRSLAEVMPRVGWSKAVAEAERRLVEAATATVGHPDIGTAVDADANTDAPPDVDTDPTCDPDQARLYTVDELTRLALRIREHLDPDGAEPRDAVKQALRGFSRPKVGADGMARGRYALPPLQLGVFLTAVESILSPRTAEPDVPAG